MPPQTRNVLHLFATTALFVCAVVALLILTPRQSSATSAHAVLLQRYQSVWQYGYFFLRQDYSPDIFGSIQIPPQETFQFTGTNGFIGTSPITATLASVRLFKGASFIPEYTDDAILRLVVGSWEGAGLRTVSARDVDLATTSTGIWTEIALSDDATSLILRPNEYLAFEATRNGEGHILVPAVIQAVVESDANFAAETYLPAVQR